MRAYVKFEATKIKIAGAGDALWGGRNKSVLFVGVGPRTDVRALGDVADKLDDGSRFKVLGCRLIDPRLSSDSFVRSFGNQGNQRCHRIVFTYFAFF